MNTKNKMQFLGEIIFGIVFCLNYRAERDGSMNIITLHDVQESIKSLKGSEVSLQDIEEAISVLIADGLIDNNLIIQDETIENSLITFKVKQKVSENISKSYVNRKRFIISFVKLLRCRSKQLSDMKVKRIQNILKKISGVTVKQEEIKSVLESVSDENYAQIYESKKDIIEKKECRVINNLLRLECDAAISMWSLVAFGVICCLRERPKYVNKDVILEERVVLDTISELVGCNVEKERGFKFVDIKDELKLNKLINRSLNITVTDISNGRITVEQRFLVGPAFANLDFVSLLAFYALYSLNKEKENDKKTTLPDIVKRMKQIAREHSFQLKGIDRRNLPLMLGFLYAQGIIDAQNKIAIPNLSRFCVIIMDLKMDKNNKKNDTKIKQEIIRQCLTDMNIGKIEPVKEITFVKIDFKSLLAFYVLYRIGREPKNNDEIVEQMGEIANECSLTLEGIDRQNIPFVMSYLYSQGLINDDSTIKVRDLQNYYFAIKDRDMDKVKDDSEKANKEVEKKKEIIRQCLLKMGCKDEIEIEDVDGFNDDESGDKTYYGDVGRIFHQFNSDEIENHEWRLLDCFNDRSFLKKIIGKRNELRFPKLQDDDPVMTEFKKGQKFLWECVNARTNEDHKDYYQRLISFVSMFIYENNIFLNSLLGINKANDISIALGIEVNNAEELTAESEEIDAIMNLANPELNKKVNEYFLKYRKKYDTMFGEYEEYKNMSNEEKINDMLEDNRPTVNQFDGISMTKKFVDWVKLVDTYNGINVKDGEMILEGFEFSDPLFNELLMSGIDVGYLLLLKELLGDKPRDDFMPFVPDLRIYIDEYKIKYKEKCEEKSKEEECEKLCKEENQNRKRALYILLYSLYRYIKERQKNNK